MARRSFRLPLLAVAMLPALAGCGRDSDSAVRVAVIGEPGSLFVSGSRLPYGAQLVRSATAEGLVGFDEQGRVVPALADRWIITDDGQSYIFRLRDGTWPDGGPITGESARQALEQALASLRGTPLGEDLSVIDEVRTMAGRVIEIRLVRQFPDLLQLLAQPELGLARKGRGSGPMRLVRNGDVATLTPIAPVERGLPDEEDWTERVRKLRLVALPPERALSSFNDGEAGIVLGGQIQDFPRINLGGFSRGAIRLDPVAGLFGLAVLHGDGFLADPGNREAIAMAVDRDALIGAFNLGGWTATTRIVTPGLEGDPGTVGERWIGQSLSERRANAAARVARWRASGHNPDPLRIAMPAGPGSELLFRRIASDLQAIGLGTKLVGEGAAADLRLVDTVARYPRASWFLNQLSCANAHGLCSATADLHAAQGLAEPDPVKRAELLAQAEADLTIANSFIPFGVPVRWSLVSGNVTGFAPNGWNAHPLMPMAMRPR